MPWPGLCRRPANDPTDGCPDYLRLAGCGHNLCARAADELRDFLASIEDSEWFVPIFLAANTGMRRGEVLGLTRRNVDLDTGRLTVSQQILSVEYEAKVADVKTSHSRPTIDLDPKTVAVLRAWRRQQLERKLATGQRKDEGFVFTREDGGPIHPDAFSQSWERLVRSSPAFTMTVYQHVLPGMQADAAAAFSAAVFGGS